MSCQWRNPDTGRYDDRSDVVIPYKSVIEFYLKEQIYLEDSLQGRRQRKIGGDWLLDFIEEFQAIFARWLLTPLPGKERGEAAAQARAAQGQARAGCAG